LFDYEEKGGTRQTASELKVDEHVVVKTLVFEDETGQALIVLMHGDKEVSQKELARIRGCKRVQPCDAAKAMKLTGYQFGGTSPFGTKTKFAVYVEKTIFNQDNIYINGGKRGFIVAINPADLRKAFDITEIEAAIVK
jgi:Cys-tRNA(Pro) deacylase